MAWEMVRHCAVIVARAVPAATETTSEPNAIHPQLEEAPKREIGTAVRILSVVAWSAFLSFSRMSTSAEAFGYALGALFFPFVIAYGITRKERGWVRFSYWFLGLGLVLPLLSAPKGLRTLSQGDLLKEMAGTKPAESGLSSQDQEQLTVSKAIFSDMRESRRSYDERLGVLEPELANLYSDQSFTSPEGIERALKVLDQKMTLDRENLAVFENFPNLVESHLNQSNLSEKGKRDFLRGFLEKYNSSNVHSAWKNMVVAEQGWVDATTDLYKYAARHVGEVIIEKGQLAIASGHTRDQFNAKLERSQKLREEFIAAAKQLDDARNEGMKAAGVTPTDLGFSN